VVAVADKVKVPVPAVMAIPLEGELRERATVEEVTTLRSIIRAEYPVRFTAVAGSPVFHWSC
jgi:hypothetical protein